MNDHNQTQLGKTLWNIADTLRGAMNADDFRDYMLSFLFLRYLSDNYEIAARKELGRDYPDPKAIGNGGRSPLSVWYTENPDDVAAFEKQMRLKAHYVIKPEHLWTSIAHMARTQDHELLNTCRRGSSTLKKSRSRAHSAGCFPRSISPLKSSAGPTRIATPNSAPLSPRLRKGSPTSHPTWMRWATPTSI
jgi:type I restriction enzyme M protein